MESKNILLRKELDSKNLRYHLKRFFKLSEFSSEYIGLQTKIGESKYDLSRESLGKYIYIDVNNKGQITNYIDYLIDHFDRNSKKDNLSKIFKLSFVYNPISKDEYEDFLNKLSKNNPFMN